MKISFQSFPILILFLVVHLNSICQSININIKSSRYNAIGDGLTDDHDAFLMAANDIMANQIAYPTNATADLYIPVGTYIIGRQYPYGTPNNKQVISTTAFGATAVLSLLNCSNVTIHGDAGTIIRLKNGLYYGTFDPITKVAITGQSSDPQTIAFVGDVFRFENCTNINVNNIQFDGNQSNLIIGGGYGGTGIQIPNYGINIVNSFPVSLSSLSIHHFGLDGLIINNVTTPSTSIPHAINISNINISYSGRNNVSWIGGDNVNFTNCKLSYAGKGTIGSLPMAGIDLEAEVANINNGTFTNCVFDNNKSEGVNGVEAYDSQGNLVYTVSNQTFNDCQFIQSPSDLCVVYFQSKNLYNWVFNKSQFYGRVTTDWSSDKLGFKDCLFQDCYNGNTVINDPNQYLLTLFKGNGVSTIIDNCTFNAYTIHTASLGTAALASDKIIEIKNSIFNSFLPLPPSEGGSGVFNYVKLSNNNFNYPSSNNNFQYIFSNFTDNGNGKVSASWPTSFTMPQNCTVNSCLSNNTVSTNVYAPNTVFKASQSISASSKIDISATSSVAPSSVKFVSGGYIEFLPTTSGFNTGISSSSFIEAYIKPCLDNMVFGRPTKLPTSFSANPIFTTEKINIFPNPAKGQFNLILKNLTGKIALVNIYDVNGRLVYTTQLALLYNLPTSAIIKTAFFNKSIYIVKVFDALTSFSKKLIVE